jgi:hypothetical protein
MKRILLTVQPVIRAAFNINGRLLPKRRMVLSNPSSHEELGHCSLGRSFSVITFFFKSVWHLQVAGNVHRVACIEPAFMLD